jgi:hypothetical protein
MRAPRLPLVSSHILIQKAPGAISPRIKHAGLEPDHSFQTGTKYMNVWTYTLCPDGDSAQFNTGLTLDLPCTRFVVIRPEGQTLSLQVSWLYLLLLRVVKSIQLSFIAGRRVLPNRCTSVIKPILITRAALLYLNKPDNTPAKLHIFSQSIT